MLGRLLGGFITILVGVTVLPTVADQVTAATNTSGPGENITGAANTVTGLITLFFALGIMSAGISIAIGGLRDAGLM